MKHFDVLVAGAGPAGLAAAFAAAAGGASVALVDDNVHMGGQIWRSEQGGPAAQRWFARVRHPRIAFMGGTKIVAAPTSGVLLAQTERDATELGFGRLVLATGARERFLPFPGWTLPGVMGVGGMEALVKGGLPVRGKRVIVAGSGPLLLAVAADLRQHGADIRLVAEQTSPLNLARFAPHLLSHPDKLLDAARFGRILRGVPYLPGAWVTAAHGDGRVEAVDIQIGDRTRTEPCDMLAYGLGLVPNLDLPITCGCRVADGVVVVDQWQRTSVETIFCAGEGTGIGGVDASLVEGLIAGLAATDQHTRARRLFSRRDATRRFSVALDKHFRLRPELRTLPNDDTIVCRCEDVSYGELAAYDSWRDAKLQSRCGMGPCQGRICGAATDVLFGWNQDSVRPPIAPARVETLLLDAR